MGLFTTFYEPPTPNQVWSENKDGKKIYKVKKHHEESWVELFIDLIYVGLFITLSLAFKDCSKKEGLSTDLFVSIATLILIMFTFRMSIDSFSNRFLSDDLFGRLLYLVYAYGLALIVLDVDGAEKHECHHLGMQTDGLIVGYMICRAMSLVMLATAMFAYPTVVPQYLYEIIVKLFIFIISFSIMAFRDGRPLFLLVTTLLEFVLLVALGGVLKPVVTLKLFHYPADTDLYVVPLNLSVAQRRLCMWCMMILGESVIQLVEPDIDQSKPDRTYWYFSAGMILIFTYALLYCDSVLREHLDSHAMRRSPFAGAIWVWMHPVVGFSMFIIGVSIKLSFSEVVYGYPVSNENNYMLGIGCGCTVIFLMIMRGTHKGLSVIKKSGFSKKSLLRFGNYMLRMVFALLHFIVADYSYRLPEPDYSTQADSRDQSLYIHAALAAGSVIVEMIGARINRKGAKPAAHGHEPHDEAVGDSNSLRSQSDSTSTGLEDAELRKSFAVELGPAH